MTPAYPDPATLLPHAGTACWIRRVIEQDENRIVCEARLPADCALAGDAGVPAYAGLELAAQASALLEGLRAMAAGGRAAPRLGYLVRARRLRWPRPWLPAVTPLRVEVRREGIAGPLHLYEGTVRVGDEVRFTGRFGTFTGIDP